MRSAESCAARARSLRGGTTGSGAAARRGSAAAEEDLVRTEGLGRGALLRGGHGET